jgi:hypothetical protein
MKKTAFILIWSFISIIFYSVFPEFDNRYVGFFEGLLWCLSYDFIFIKNQIK